MFQVFSESREWTKMIDVENSVDLNRVVTSGKISDLIKMDETIQSSRLLKLAQQINAKKDKVATITAEQVRKIAEYKMPDLNANDVEAALRIIEGTARQMGVVVEGMGK